MKIELFNKGTWLESSPRKPLKAQYRMEIVAGYTTPPTKQGNLPNDRFYKE